MSHVDRLPGVRNQLNTLMGSGDRNRENQVVELDCDEVAPREQSRKNFNNIEELAANIEQHGQQQPIKVQLAQGNVDAEYEIVMGERRWRACKMLGKKVKAIIMPRVEDLVNLLALELIENLQRENLDPFEIANGLAKLSASKKTNRQIAAMLSMSETYVSRHLKLADAPGVIRTLFYEGYSQDSEVFFMLTQLWKLDQRKAEAFIAGLTQGGGVSRKELRDLIREAKNPDSADTGTDTSKTTARPGTEDVAKRFEDVVKHQAPSAAPSPSGQAEQNDSPLVGSAAVSPSPEASHAAPQAQKRVDAGGRAPNAENAPEKAPEAVSVKVSFFFEENPDSHMMGSLLLQPGPDEDNVYVVDGGGQVHAVPCENVAILRCVKS